MPGPETASPNFLPTPSDLHRPAKVDDPDASVDILQVLMANIMSNINYIRAYLPAGKRWFEVQGFVFVQLSVFVISLFGPARH
jgi:hypothetical protein